MIDWKAEAEDVLRPHGLTQQGKFLSEVSNPIIAAVQLALMGAYEQGWKDAIVFANKAAEHIPNAGTIPDGKKTV